MNRLESTLWQSKYRPKTIDTYAATDEFKDLLTKYVEQQDIPNLLLYGIQGTGKTSAAKLLTELIDCDYIYINASDDRTIEVVREKIVKFASVRTLSNLKIIILDEADGIGHIAQLALKSVMETYDRTVRFILTSNNPLGISDPVKSRCKEIEFDGLPKSKIAKIVADILEKEKVQYKLDDLKRLVDTYYPDLRKTIVEAQSYTDDNVMTLPEDLGSNKGGYEVILNLLVKSEASAWKNVRQHVADAEIANFNPVYTYLYQNIDKFPANMTGKVIIALGEAQYQTNFVIDREITFMACIAQILK